jgi:hypothetical protein
MSRPYLLRCIWCRAFTAHVYHDERRVMRGVEQIYRCLVCGQHRRYRLYRVATGRAPAWRTSK